MRHAQEFSSLPLKRSGIYQIRNLYTEDFYIGSTQCFKSRFICHLYDLRRGKHSNQKLQTEFNKYGESGFAFEVLEDMKDITRLRELEQKYIDENNPKYNNYSKSGYSHGAIKPKRIKGYTHVIYGVDNYTPEWRSWIYGGRTRPR